MATVQAGASPNQHLAARELLAEHLVSCPILGVQVKTVLAQVNANESDVVHDGLQNNNPHSA